jgi:hypothetical protein
LHAPDTLGMRIERDRLVRGIALHHGCGMLLVDRLCACLAAMGGRWLGRPCVSDHSRARSSSLRI